MMKRPFAQDANFYNEPRASLVPPIPTQARQAAYMLLHTFDETGEFVSRLGEQSIWARKLAPRERLLGLRIAETTILRRLTIKMIMQQLVNKPWEEIEPGLKRLLEIGCSQLLFLPDIEHHAAVFETVELAQWMNHTRWKGFANGILRELQRQSVNLSLQSGDEQAEFATVKLPGTNTLLNEKLVPEGDPTILNSFLYSLPAWLVERWLARFTTAEFQQITEASLQDAPLSIRINKSRISREELVKSWTGLEIEIFLPPDQDSLLILSSVELAKLPGFEQGYFFIQDISAMQAVKMLDPQPGECILDICAAPGSKTIQIADALQGTGEVVATDVLSDRLARVQENIKRSRFDNVKALLINKNGTGLPSGKFDAVLVDAPCSNTGVLGKRPEVRARISAGDFQELGRLQLSILKNAVSALKPAGGRIVYSTCSIEPEENKGVIKNFLKEFPQFTCTKNELILPKHDSSTNQFQDGAFMALFVKK
jgi:16S rRNA (cytosine967-C5)-methyltransferase